MTGGLQATQKGSPVPLYVLFILCMTAAAYTGKFFVALLPFVALVMYSGWISARFVFFLLLGSVPFSFEYQFSSDLGTDIPDELLMLLVSFVFFAYWLWSPRVLSLRTLSHPLLLLLAATISWTTITVVSSTDALRSLKFLLAKSWYIGAFVVAPLILFRHRKHLITASVLLATSMLLVTLVIMLRHAMLGFSFAGINQAVVPFFRNHVNYSALLVCILPVWVAIYVMVKQKTYKRLIAGIVLVLLLALFLSYARGAWLALLVGLFAYFLIRVKALLATYLVAVVALGVTICWLANKDRYLRYAPDYTTTIFHQDFRQHLVSTYKLKDLSTAERFYRWIAGVRMIRDKAFTGFGPNTFYDQYKPYAIPAYKTWVSDNPERSTVHNYFLLVAIEQGVPGVLILLILLGAALGYAQYSYHHIRDRLYKIVSAISGVILAMIAVLNFFSDLVETDKIGSVFFLCLAALVVANLQGNRRSDLSADVQRIS